MPSDHNLAAVPVHSPKISVSRLTFHYGRVRALEDISLTVYENRVTALIGHSGSGKSTFLRTLNRINESMQNTRVDGEILLDGENVLHMDVAKVRKRVGMVFQSCNPFPKSIFDNMAYGPRIHGYSRFGATDRAAMRDAVEQSLQRAGLWHEVKDRLKHHAYSLSVGQQQRLCIARALAINPEVLLLDEPCSALDPIATAKIEHLICELKRSCTILIVTHNMAQAKRIADYTGSLAFGRLAQFDVTSSVIGKEFPEIHHEAHGAHG
jgi:phosphate transport system ATP-binding protein